MVAIFRYCNGLMFTGWVAKSEEEAWKFLDKKYGYIYKDGTQDRCNHEAFKIVPVEIINEKPVEIINKK